MTYYIVLLCNWSERSNAIVRGIELTTTNPESYVSEANDYVYVQVPSTEVRNVDTIMNDLVQGIGEVAMPQKPSNTLSLSWPVFTAWKTNAGLAPSRKLNTWNDVAKPAWQRLAHAAGFGTL